MKKLIPALCMLLVAAALMGTSTYAWFSMNQTVLAQEMKVKAVAEEGIFISNAADGEYSDKASPATSTVAELRPASTSNLSDWYHSTSNDPAASTSNGTYTTITGEDGYYVTHNFYIRSSSPLEIEATSIDVKSVSVTAANPQNLSNAIRVGVKIGTSLAIYAPLATSNKDYNVWNGTAIATPVTANKSDVESNLTISTPIPANNAAGTQVSVYIWFEGEDADCKSSNLEATLEQLDVSVVFGFTPAT